MAVKFLLSRSPCLSFRMNSSNVYAVIFINLCLRFRWWRGQSGCMQGWFPSNYTQEEEQDDNIHTYAMAENVLDVVVALYPFTANSDQELSFDKGDRLEILDRPPADPEWYKARNNQGQVGLVPRNYLQVCFLSFSSVNTIFHINSTTVRKTEFGSDSNTLLYYYNQL